MSGAAVIEGAYVLSMDEHVGSGFRDVAIVADRIIEVAPIGQLRSAPHGAERIDAANTVMLPGLVNAHLHPEAHVLKGWVEGLDLHGWRRAHAFNGALAHLGTAQGREIQLAATRAALADSLLCGVTTVATYGVSAGADEVAAQVLEELGLHGHITIRDVDFTPVAKTPAWRCQPPRMYRLHAEEALTEAELEAAAAAAARGERIVMHAAETRARQRLVRRRFGTRTIGLLDRYGLLSPRLLLSHAVHVDGEERARIAGHGAMVIASPAAEMKLGDGIAPLRELCDLGVTVALGTDSAICNNGNDLLLEARMMGLSQALRYGAGAFRALELLRCATTNGARVLGEEDVHGRIAPGLRADLVLLDADSARMRPFGADTGPEHVATNVVYAATAGDVRDVMVAGRWRVRNGTLVDVDTAGIWRALEGAASRLPHRIG